MSLTFLGLAMKLLPDKYTAILSFTDKVTINTRDTIPSRLVTSELYGNLELSIIIKKTHYGHVVTVANGY